MFNFELLSLSLKDQPNIDLNSDTNSKNKIKEIGILSDKTIGIKFQYNWNYIFANGKAIISTCNDDWSAANSFARTMQASFGENFILDKSFPTIK